MCQHVDKIHHNIYTRWGILYSKFLVSEWDTFLRISQREKDNARKNYHWIDENTVNSVLYWVDENIFGSIGLVNSFTLDVRVRIACGMINKLDLPYLTRDLKIQLVECIWCSYRKATSLYNEWYCRNIEGLPF